MTMTNEKLQKANKLAREIDNLLNEVINLESTDKTILYSARHTCSRTADSDVMPLEKQIKDFALNLVRKELVKKEAEFAKL